MTLPAPRGRASHCWRCFRDLEPTPAGHATGTLSVSSSARPGEGLTGRHQRCGARLPGRRRARLHTRLLRDSCACARAAAACPRGWRVCSARWLPKGRAWAAARYALPPTGCWACCSETKAGLRSGTEHDFRRGKSKDDGRHTPRLQVPLLGSFPFCPCWSCLCRLPPMAARPPQDGGQAEAPRAHGIASHPWASPERPEASVHASRGLGLCPLLQLACCVSLPGKG